MQKPATSDMLPATAAAITRRKLQLELSKTLQSRKDDISPFSLYVLHNKQQIEDKYPNIDFCKLVSIAAIRWRKMTHQHQLPYISKAQQNKRISLMKAMESQYFQQNQLRRNQQIQSVYQQHHQQIQQNQSEQDGNASYNKSESRSESRIFDEEDQYDSSGINDTY